MNEQQVTQIAQKVAQQVYIQMSQRDQFKVSNTSIHTHNGIDSPTLNPADFQSFDTLGSGTGDMLALNNIPGAVFVQETSGNTVVFTIPVVSFGNGGGFNGGNAPDGTVVLATGGSAITTQLWVTYEGTWYGFQSNQTA